MSNNLAHIYRLNFRISWPPVNPPALQKRHIGQNNPLRSELVPPTLLCLLFFIFCMWSNSMCKHSYCKKHHPNCVFPVCVCLCVSERKKFLKLHPHCVGCSVKLRFCDQFRSVCWLHSVGCFSSRKLLKEKVQRKSASARAVGCLKRRLMNCRFGFWVNVQLCECFTR